MTETVEMEDGSEFPRTVKGMLEVELKLIERAGHHPGGNPRYWLIEHGKEFTGQELPDEYEPMTPQMCFLNAYLLAEEFEDELTYCEGYGMRDYLALPIHHAWVIDNDGNVIDPTWIDASPSDNYLGIIFHDFNLVRDAVDQTETYSLLFKREIQELLEAGVKYGK